MARRKKIDDTKYKVFAFMSGSHSLLLVGQDGFRVDEIEIESSDVEIAKARLENPELNERIVGQLGTGSFSTVWVDDPAGDQAVLEACRLMEEKKQAEGMAPEAAADDTAVPDEPNDGGQISINSKGMVFQTRTGGEYKNIPAKLLQIDDVCRFCPEKDMIGAFADGAVVTEYRVVASPMVVGVQGDEATEWLIQLVEHHGDEHPVAAPENFQASGKTKVIDCEVPETFTEQKLKSMIRHLQTMKIEAQADASQRREEIKEQEKAIFAACDGKSFKPMECTIENDWENAVRRYIRPDTGEVALTEQISDAERQTVLELNVPGDTMAPTIDTITMETDTTATETPEEQTEKEMEGENVLQ